MNMYIEKKIKIRIIYCIVLIVLGVVSLYVGNFVPLNTGDAEYSAGYYTGLGFGVIVAGVITIIKNVRLLKNPEKLKEREIYESDERNKMIGLKTWSYAGYAMFILLYIAQMVAGAFNVLIMNTLLAVLGLFALCLFFSRVILSKLM